MGLRFIVKQTTPTPEVWTSILDNTYWQTRSGTSTWDGSKWISGFLQDILLEPISTWATGFRPTKCRITFTPSSGNIYILDTSSNVIVSDNTIVSGVEFSLDFSNNLDMDQFSFNGLTMTTYNITNIEFTGGTPPSPAPEEGDKDSSPVDNTVVPTNMVYSVDSKFGESSANFTGSNYMTISPNTNLVLELVWTVRAWIKTSTTGQQYFLQYSTTGETTTGGYTMGIANASGYPYMVYVNSAGGFAGYKIGSSSVATGDWVHYEFARNGSNFYFFINGTSLGANGVAGGTTIMGTPTDPLSLGRSSAGTFAFTGLIDEVEIIKGVTLHTSNFSVPTVPSVATANHVLLMHMDDDGAV